MVIKFIEPQRNNSNLELEVKTKSLTDACWNGLLLTVASKSSSIANHSSQTVQRSGVHRQELDNRQVLARRDHGSGRSLNQTAVSCN